MITFTTIQHGFWKKHGLSPTEYILCDMVHFMSTNISGKIQGWCYAKKNTLADELGVSRMGLYKLIERMKVEGFLIQDSETTYLKTTPKWAEVYMEDSLHDVNKVYTERKQSLHEGRKQSLHIEYNKDNKQELKKENTDFDFRFELASLVGSEILADDFMKVRKAKKAVNSQTAFNLLLREIEKSGKSAREIIELCVLRNWQSFKSEWAMDVQTRNSEKKESFMERQQREYTEILNQLNAENGIS